MNSVQATRLRKGMLIKVGNDLFRILDLHHLTPGNKRAHIQAGCATSGR
jgi:translation elongation factor P/translation initiation factor 5A